MVPDDFGRGIVIPLLKNSDGNKFVSDNYRGITLSPIISKLFEIVMMKIFEKQLESDPLQFGFKQKSSCQHALLSLKTIVDHYSKHGSTVNICALDISKAFDRVDHYALLQLLMDRSLPRNFIGILLDWYTKCIVCVRWGGAISFWFCISAGVRQGGVLSPVLFAIYMDILVNRLRIAGYLCHLLNVFYGCLLFADDIVLLSHSVNAMQCMLQICNQFAVDFDVKFNSTKSVAMRIGCRYNATCEPLELAGDTLKYVDSVKYLGVCLIASTYFKCSVDHVKVKFYRVFNCIFSRSKSANSEMVTVQLLKSYCLPFLLYGSEAVGLSATNMHILDNCINRARTGSFILVTMIMYGSPQLRQFLGLCSIRRLVECRRKRFIDGLVESSKYGVVLKVMATNLCS